VDTFQVVEAKRWVLRVFLKLSCNILKYRFELRMFLEELLCRSQESIGTYKGIHVKSLCFNVPLRALPDLISVSDAANPFRFISADASGWCALEYVSVDRDTYVLRFRGLDPSRCCRITFEPEGMVSTVDGFVLLQQGLTIRLDTALTSRLLLCEAVQE